MIEIIIGFISVVWLLFYITRGLILIEEGEDPYKDKYIFGATVVTLIICVIALIIRICFIN